MRVFLFILLALVVCAEAGLPKWYEKFKELLKGKRGRTTPKPILDCGDIDERECRELKSLGFCTSWYYRPELEGIVTDASIKRTCGKTCNLCKKN
ncbi:hypothetical protein OESDEN_14455 [Oesophagostomum dentatum]|uniref:ShKT domain-containing protein n=1 Tax=Oesophagostomum dentatum TaxID=61180 RepID=A0A0B1SRH8_OESDE|nr:hypothetical protein OESDEN_14455 [Oesophagostomum dentatum]